MRMGSCSAFGQPPDRSGQRPRRLRDRPRAQRAGERLRIGRQQFGLRGREASHSGSGCARSGRTASSSSCTAQRKSPAPRIENGARSSLEPNAAIASRFEIAAARTGRFSQPFRGRQPDAHPVNEPGRPSRIARHLAEPPAVAIHQPHELWKQDVRESVRTVQQHLFYDRPFRPAPNCRIRSSCRWPRSASRARLLHRKHDVQAYSLPAALSVRYARSARRFRSPHFTRNRQHARIAVPSTRMPEPSSTTSPVSRYIIAACPWSRASMNLEWHRLACTSVVVSGFGAASS